MEKKYAPRLFTDEHAICRIGEGLLGCTLGKEEWTHEAHLAATVWIMVQRPEIQPERDMPAIISRYNESTGGVNDDKEGYHETITQCFIRGARAFLVRAGEMPLAELVNGLLQAPEGARDWPLRFYSRDRLFSVAARKGFVEPDIQPLP